MAAKIWVNIDSGNGLLPDGTKPLPEPMLTDHQWSSVAFILVQFHKTCLNHQSQKSVWKLQHKISFKFPRGQWVKWWWQLIVVCLVEETWKWQAHPNYCCKVSIMVCVSINLTDKLHPGSSDTSMDNSSHHWSFVGNPASGFEHGLVIIVM